MAERLSAALGGPLCWRCRGVGDSGAEFCKFCGARYAEDPAKRGEPDAMGAGFAATAAGPHHQPTVVETGLGGAAEAPARLVSILKDGSDGQIFAINGEQTDVGRREGDIVLADDPYLSPRHARIRRKGDTFFLRDLDSVNGVYIRLGGAVELSDGDMILIGQQVLRFETLTDGELPLGPASVHGVMVFGTPEVARFGRLVQYTTEGVGRDVYYLYRDETVLGRENGDIVFTDDPFLSRRHASITVDRSTRRFTLKDLGSSNGSALRVYGERPLADGDQFRLGRHLFRFDQIGGGGAVAK